MLYRGWQKNSALWHYGTVRFVKERQVGGPAEVRRWKEETAGRRVWNWVGARGGGRQQGV